MTNNTVEGSGIVGLAGLRAVGGCRASLFNGVTQDAVGRLIDFMHAFERDNRMPHKTARQGELTNV